MRIAFCRGVRSAALLSSPQLPARLALLADFLCSVLFAPFPNHGAWYQVITRGMIVKMKLSHKSP